MNDKPASNLSHSLRFQIFKYMVFALLGVNALQYFMQDYTASQQVFSDGLKWSQIIEAYAVTTDTVAWLVLLIMFDLETSVLSHERLQEVQTRWLINFVKVLCYGFVIYALYGYIVKFLVIQSFEPFGIKDLCTQLDEKLVFMTSLDSFASVNSETCISLVSSESMYRIPGANVVADSNTLQISKNLATTDVINASNWVLIVIILQADLLMKLRGDSEEKFAVVVNGVKGVLYAVLLGCAIYWGISGVFLDFWDAFLWIVAFAFIELNVFDSRDQIPD